MLGHDPDAELDSQDLDDFLVGGPGAADPVVDDDDDPDAEAAASVALRQFMVPRNANVYSELSDLNDRAREAEDESGSDAPADEDAAWSAMPAVTHAGWRREDDDIIPANAAKRKPTRTAGRTRTRTKPAGPARAPRLRRPKAARKVKPAKTELVVPAVEPTPVPEHVVAETVGAEVRVEEERVASPPEERTTTFSPPVSVFANFSEPTVQFTEAVEIGQPLEAPAPKPAKEGGRLKRLATMEIKLPKRRSA